MKKQIAVLIVVILLAVLIVVCLILPSVLPKPQSQVVRIGVCVYKAQDTFVGVMVKELEYQTKRCEYETGEKISIDVSDSQESQRTQNRQVERYIALGYDVICVNPVDRTNISDIIDMAVDAQIPLVFFNREPVETDILRADNVYYVGSDAKQSAVLQGEIIADKWETDIEAIDKNQNDVLEYIMLEGESGHQDAIIRTKWSVQTLTQKGIKTKRIASGVANWDRNQAAALIDQWYKENTVEAEIIICNNDEMALGAAEALEHLGITDIPIVGVDATVNGVDAVRTGKMLGTVDCNAKLHGQNIFALAYPLAKGEAIPKDIVLENERYLRIELTKVTKASLDG